MLREDLGSKLPDEYSAEAPTKAKAKANAKDSQVQRPRINFKLRRRIATRRLWHNVMLNCRVQGGISFSKATRERKHK